MGRGSGDFLEYPHDSSWYWHLSSDSTSSAFKPIKWVEHSPPTCLHGTWMQYLSPVMLVLPEDVKTISENLTPQSRKWANQSPELAWDTQTDWLTAEQDHFNPRRRKISLWPQCNKFPLIHQFISLIVNVSQVLRRNMVTNLYLSTPENNKLLHITEWAGSLWKQTFCV